MKTKDLMYLEIYQTGWINGYGKKGKAMGDPMCRGDFLSSNGADIFKQIRITVNNYKKLKWDTKKMQWTKK